MTTYRSLNHTKWCCQYHVVFIPKYRRKAMYGGLRKELGEVFRRLAVHRESEVEEGHLLPDHVHMMMSIPPKYSVAQVIGYLKGKSAIHIAREFAGRSRNFVGQHFWARGYFVSTVGRDERVIRRLAVHRESEVEEGHLLPDHVHMMMSIPPKYSVAQVIGYLKGKSAIHIAREFAGRSRNFVGQHFWARGYFVSTVGRDERVIREYIQQQEREDRRRAQLPLD